MNGLVRFALFLGFCLLWSVGALGLSDASHGQSLGLLIAALAGIALVSSAIVVKRHSS